MYNYSQDSKVIFIPQKKPFVSLDQALVTGFISPQSMTFTSFFGVPFCTELPQYSI